MMVVLADNVKKKGMKIGILVVINHRESSNSKKKKKTEEMMYYVCSALYKAEQVVD